MPVPRNCPIRVGQPASSLPFAGFTLRCLKSQFHRHNLAQRKKYHRLRRDTNPLSINAEKATKWQGAARHGTTRHGIVRHWQSWNTRVIDLAYRDQD